MRVVVNRQTWIRGEWDSFLLRSTDGKQCCLGFYLEQAGVPRACLLDMTTPYSVVEDHKVDVPETLINKHEISAFTRSTLFSNHAMRVNDQQGCAEGDRELKLQALFRDAGLTLIFTNDEEEFQRELALSNQLAKSEHLEG